MSPGNRPRCAGAAQYGVGPQTITPAAAYPTTGYAATAAGTAANGNPYWRQGRPRATLLGGPIATPVPTAAGPNVAPPSAMTNFPPAPITAMPAPAAVAPAEMVAAVPTPATIAPPNPVLPQYGTPQPAEAPAPAAGPQLMAAVPQPTALPPVAVEAPPPAEAHPAAALHGIEILRQPAGDTAQSLRNVAAWAEDALTQMQGLRDYTCTFKKREAVDGKLGEQQTMFVKSRPQPLSVYMYFLDQDVKGQEAIYVDGRNNGHIVAHPVGFKQTLVGTLSLAPNDPQAMEGNRYPITNFGIVNLTHRYLQGIQTDMQFNECEVKVIPGARVNERSCTCIQVVHAQQRREFRYAMTRLYIDDELNLPIRYEGYEFPRRGGDAPLLAEEYTYSNLKINVGLTDVDFDPRNPQYGYK
ncbi:MAG: DUF1571 domain-containing protein [Pirellulales bacterium]